MSFETRYEIIDGIREQDDEAWKNFYNYYYKLIRLHGKDCGIKEELLDELVQDVMISMAKLSKKFVYDPEKGRFRDLLKKIIRARAIDILRKFYSKESMLVHLHDDMSSISSIPAESIPNGEELDQKYYDKWRNIFIVQCLRMLRSKLSPTHYQIYHMLEYQNISVPQVAELMGLSPVSVYSIRSRTESKLSKIAHDLASKLPEEAINWKLIKLTKNNRRQK